MTEFRTSLPRGQWLSLSGVANRDERFGRPPERDLERIKSQLHPNLLVRQSVRRQHAEIDTSSQPVTSFIKDIVAATKTIPKAFRSSAEIEFDFGDDVYGSRISIFCERPETDEEMAARIDRHVLYAWQTEQREKETLRNLSAKYSTSG